MSVVAECSYKLVWIVCCRSVMSYYAAISIVSIGIGFVPAVVCQQASITEFVIMIILPGCRNCRIFSGYQYARRISIVVILPVPISSI